MVVVRAYSPVTPIDDLTRAVEDAHVAECGVDRLAEQQLHLVWRARQGLTRRWNAAQQHRVRRGLPWCDSAHEQDEPDDDKPAPSTCGRGRGVRVAYRPRVYPHGPELPNVARA